MPLTYSWSQWSRQPDPPWYRSRWADCGWEEPNRFWERFRIWHRKRQHSWCISYMHGRLRRVLSNLAHVPPRCLQYLPYSRKIWRFGGLYYNRQIKIRQNFLLAYMYICMAILYWIAQFKSTNIFAIAILGSSAKFNSHQYFRLYGMIIITNSCSLGENSDYAS